MVKSLQLNVKNVICSELESRKYTIFDKFELKKFDISFNTLAESQNRRTIFVIEIIEELNILNNLSKINVNIRGLKQLFAIKNQERMIFLILIVNATEIHVLEAIKDFKTELDEYNKIIIDIKDLDISTPYYKVFLRSKLPITLLSSSKRKIDSRLIKKVNIEEFLNKNSLIKVLNNYRDQKNRNYENIIQELLRERTIAVKNNTY